MRHIPNILSIFRILLIPFFIWQMLSGNTFYAAVILLVSAVTDMADGFLARRFGWVSQLGKILDPAADKLTQVTVCVVLAIVLKQYWYFFAALLVKDVIMLVLGGYLVKKKIKIDGARWFGKIVTILFYITTILIVFSPNIPYQLTVTLLAITTISAFIAGIMYIPKFKQYKKNVRNSNPE